MGFNSCFKVLIFTSDAQVILKNNIMSRDRSVKTCEAFLINPYPANVENMVRS